MEELIRFISKFQPLDHETEEAVKVYFEEEVYRKNEFLVEEGKICTKINFIKSGLVRRFYIDDGNEITKWLYHDNHWIAVLSSYFNQKPSFEFL
jgi:CRP/FNR family transcriptional regulator, anaerobic regulatory protein